MRDIRAIWNKIGVFFNNVKLKFTKISQNYLQMGFIVV